MSRLLEVDRVDNLVIPIVLITLQVFRLASVSRAAISFASRVIHADALVEEKSIVGFGSLDKPVHCLYHVRPGGDLTGIPRIVSKHDDIFRSIIVSVYT